MNEQLPNPACANCDRSDRMTTMCGRVCNATGKRREEFPDRLAIVLVADAGWCPFHRFEGED